MKREEILSELRKVVAPHSEWGLIGQPDFVLTEETIFKEAEFDSLDTIEMLMEVEKRFELVIPDDVGEKLTSVKDLIDYLEKKVR